MEQRYLLTLFQMELLLSFCFIGQKIVPLLDKKFVNSLPIYIYIYISPFDSFYPSLSAGIVRTLSIDKRAYPAAKYRSVERMPAARAFQQNLVNKISFCYRESVPIDKSALAVHPLSTSSFFAHWGESSGHSTAVPSMESSDPSSSFFFLVVSPTFEESSKRRNRSDKASIKKSRGKNLSLFFGILLFRVNLFHFPKNLIIQFLQSLNSQSRFRSR